jgi:hypothetical protein
MLAAANAARPPKQAPFKRPRGAAQFELLVQQENASLGEPRLNILFNVKECSGSLHNKPIAFRTEETGYNRSAEGGKDGIDQIAWP